MKTSMDCIPCFLQQALEAARFVTTDPVIHEQIIRKILRTAAEMDLEGSPPLLARAFYRLLRETAGVGDPYAPVRQRLNRLVLEMLPDLKSKVAASSDPLTTAVRFAIAGNIIDFGVSGRITEEDLRGAFAGALSQRLSGDVEDLRQAVGHAAHILYLADNAGEIVLDRLLIEQLPRDRVVLVVRGHPIFYDATMADARSAGLYDLVRVIDSGSDVPGTALCESSVEVEQQFARADLVIAKGQGNFETLSEEPGNIFFLLRVKCAFVASHVGLPVGALALLHR